MQDAAATSWVIEVTDASFEQEVIERSKEVPVLVDFWAPWCGPCRQLGPLLEGLAAERKGAFVLAKINVDEAQEVAGYFQISSIPAVLAFQNGQPVDGFVGLLGEEELNEFIGRFVPSQLDDAIRQAQQLETTQPEQVEVLYRTVLERDPDHEAAKVGLARLLVHAKKDAEAIALLDTMGTAGEFGAEGERLRRVMELRAPNKAATGDEAVLRQKIEADPDNARLRYELGSSLATQERYPEALEMLLSAAERDSALGRTEVREMMVKIFEIIGMRSDMADEYRDKLRAMIY